MEKKKKVHECRVGGILFSSRTSVIFMPSHVHSLTVVLPCVPPLKDQRCKLSVFAMGNTCSNNLGIPPAKGPHPVGCTDFMMDYTVAVKHILS